MNMDNRANFGNQILSNNNYQIFYIFKNAKKKSQKSYLV